MMRLMRGLTVMCLAVFTVTACKKNENSTPAEFMTATVAGTAFSASGASQAYSSTSSSGGMNFIYISGSDASGKLIKITLIDNSGTGTTAFNAGDAAAYYFASGLSGSFTLATSGSVTITALSPNIVGTFSFTCADGTVVSNGSFSVKAI